MSRNHIMLEGKVMYRYPSWESNCFYMSYPAGTIKVYCSDDLQLQPPNEARVFVEGKLCGEEGHHFIETSYVEILR